MTPEPALSRVIGGFSDLRVVVVGEAMLDGYLEGAAGRLCREAPVPIVTVTRHRDAPGGAANAAANARSLGARVRLLAVVGDDAEAERLCSLLRARGIDVDGVLPERRRRTLTKRRVVADGQLLVRFDEGTTAPIAGDTERRLIAALAGAVPAADAVIVSDYGYGVMTPAVVRALAGLQARAPRVLVVDSRRLAEYRPVGATAVKPNYDEAAQLLGGRVGGGRTRAECIAAHGDLLLDLTGARLAAVTLDGEGAVLLERDRAPYRTYARPARHCRAAGAGDTFASALALALAAGGSVPVAAEIASAAAAVVVGKERTATCSAFELRESLWAEGKVVTDLDRLRRRLAFHRAQGQRVVFTNGCFDILHRGHIACLNLAKTLGDLLVVGLNSDASIRRLKGAGRPINGLEDRAHVLAALSCVDHIVPFEEDTPAEIIRAIRPDIYVKGGDYTRERLVEAPLVQSLGGAVHILPYVEDRSTTSIIARIRDGDRPPRRARAA